MSDSSPPARYTPSPTSPGSSSLHKLPKFLHRHHQSRDRSRSFTDGPYSSSAESSDSAALPSRTHRTLSRKTSRLFGVRERDEYRSSSETGSRGNTTEHASDAEAPTIVEPASSSEGGALIPRPRTRSDRPLSLSTFNVSSRLQVNGSSPTRIADISGRLSGWFQHAFSSTTDLSLPPSNLVPSSSSGASINSLSQSLPPSSASSPRSQKPRTSSPAASIMQHIPGKANIERAVRYLLDSDIAQPDRCTDPIWLMGIEHPGYEPAALAIRAPSSPHHRGSTDLGSIGSTQRPVSSNMSHSGNATFPSASNQALQTVVGSPTGKQSHVREITWPPSFYDDFTSRIWLTYRSHYPPIRDHTLKNLETPIAPGNDQTHLLPDLWSDHASQMSGASPPKPRWGWGGEKTWTSDTGWGCMLRTGQSLLANALIHLHISRDWRRPAHPNQTVEYATYVKILSWFLDTPSPLAPFGVHRMALAGKDLGKDVGSWFGPSTAAGAIKTLVHAFPSSGLAVSAAVDGVLYESDVYAASNLASVDSPQSSMSPSFASGASKRGKSGRRRWGNKAVLVLVNIRLGLDGVNPVYHDSVKKLFTFPQSVGIAGGRPSSSYYFIGYQGEHLFYLDPHHTRPAVPLQPLSEGNDAPTPPKASRSRVSRQSSLVENAASPRSKRSQGTSGVSRSSTIHYQESSTSTAIAKDTLFPRAPPSPSPSAATILDPISSYYATAYSFSDLRTFHCERVRKMPISSLDPSMLLGFLCRDENEWKDLRSRIAELGRNRAIFSVLDEPPSWGDDSDDDVGMESVSETESEVLSINGDGDGGDDDDDASTGTVDISTDATMPPLDDLEVMTPGPILHPGSFDRSGKIDDGEESWINPSPPKPVMPLTPSADRRASHHHTRSQSMTSTTRFTLVSPPSSDSSSAHSQQFPFPVSSTEDTPGEDIQSKRPRESERDTRTSRVKVGNGT